MSQKNSGNRCTKSDIKANIKAKKREKALLVQRNITLLALVILLVVGLVSTSFATFNPAQSSEIGKLIADIRTNAVNRADKNDIVDLSADVDIAQTGATITGGTVFYLDATNWGYSDARYAAYFCNGSSSAVWVNATKVSGNIFTVTVPSGGSHANIIWCRMDGSKTSNNWENVWNQTADLVWDGTNTFYTINGFSYGTWSKPSFFNTGDIVYFDIRNNEGWLTADSSSQMYIQFDDSKTGNTSNRASMTRIGTHLYMYKFTSVCSGSIRFWRGNATNMWNYSKSLSKANGNGVYIASNGWSGSGTEATFTLTGLSKPTVSVAPASITLGEYTNLGVSTLPTLSYNIGSTEYTTDPIASDLRYTFKSGSSTIISNEPTGTYSYKPSTAGTFSITVTVNSVATGLTSTASDAITLTVKAKFTYTISANTGGKVTPISGSVADGDSVTITATADTGYTFAGWINATNGTLGSTTAATTTFKPTASGAKVTAAFRPDAPSALVLTGAPVATGTAGNGTQNNPYIVFENSGFTLTAKATVVSGATAHYSHTANGEFAQTETFTPSLVTKGVSQSYIVYAKAIADGYYSTNSINATAYYMVFSHLNGANTGFTVSSDNITDIESVTLSGAYVNGVDEAEKQYITQTYQISTNNSTFSDITGNVWTPNTIGTYYFRLKTTNTKTGETVYSSSKSVTVVQSTVYYDIHVTNEGTVDAEVTLSSNGTIITNGEILSNSPLTVSISRPSSEYYIEYLEIDTMTGQDCMNINGDIVDYLAYDHIKGDVYINYKLAVKPKVTVNKPDNAASINFEYYVDGTKSNKTVAGTYCVDYDSSISYSVTPDTDYYVKSMTGVSMGPVSASTATGTKSNVTADINPVTATLTNNNTITVNVDTTSAVTEGGSMTVDGSAVALGTPKALNYGVESAVVITPPEGYYAVVSGNSVSADISTDGKATFKVTLTGINKVYTVKFVENPRIYMVQPEFGSVYVTDDLDNYYFDGDPVGYGTKLTVHVKPDHSSAVLSDVLVNNASIGNADGSTFIIKSDSTATAEITVDEDFIFDTNTEYGTRRIIFTDTFAWGKGKVSVHYSNVSGDTDFSKNSIVMTQKYYNSYNQYVYYADIPFSAKYVTFYNNSNTSQRSAQGTITSDYNAYYCTNTAGYPAALNLWNFAYSDYIATDREETIQQAITSKNQAAQFSYTCDFGDDTLKAELVSGNAVNVDFDAGVLSITPTDDTYNHSLVKISSTASGMVKYYLIRVENFEIVSFTGLQKIYNTNVFNNIQLDLILNGGVLNYAANYLVSDTNAVGSFATVNGTSSGFEEVGSIEGYVNSFLIEYAINAISGVKYYKVEASDSAGHSANATLKTLFGTNSYNGERTLYFYNDTNVALNKYKLRACFMDENKKYPTFVTMQQVGNTDYYRAVIPQNAQGFVNFYLCNPKTFSYNYTDFDGIDDSTEFYSFGLFEAKVPDSNNANIVYKVDTIDETGINGSFVDFNY